MGNGHAEVARLRFDDLDALGRSWPCSIGRDGAEDFAARNVAVVTRYWYFPLEDRIEVDVQLVPPGRLADVLVPRLIG